METLPLITTEADLDAFREEPHRWGPTLGALATSLGLGGEPIADLGGGNLVVSVGERHVLKLAPPVFARELVGEREALALVGGALPVPCPRLFAHGEHDGWAYLLMERLPGRTARERWAEIPHAGRLSLVRQVGEALRCLHALPLPSSGPLAPAWQAYAGEHGAACVERQRRWGVPEGVLADLPALLGRTPYLETPREALIHADLTSLNLLVDEDASRPGGWGVSGIIDFGDALGGAPLFDLAAPALLLGRGEAPLLAALLDGYGVPPSARDGALRDLFTAYAALHPFNPLTRYLGFGGRTAEDLDSLGRAMFPW